MDPKLPLRYVEERVARATTAVWYCHVPVVEPAGLRLSLLYRVANTGYCQQDKFAHNSKP